CGRSCGRCAAGSTTTWTPRRWTSCATTIRRSRPGCLPPVKPGRPPRRTPAMPIDWPVLLAALLSGLSGGLHCAAMCGGIATSFPAMGPHGDLRYVPEPTRGRVLGYVVAGAVAGGVGGGIVAVARSPWLGVGLRVAVGLVLVVAALRLFDVRGRLAFLGGNGAMWQWLRPLQRRLLPAASHAKR